MEGRREVLGFEERGETVGQRRGVRAKKGKRKGRVGVGGGRGEGAESAGGRPCQRCRYLVGV